MFRNHLFKIVSSLCSLSDGDLFLLSKHMNLNLDTWYVHKTRLYLAGARLKKSQTVLASARSSSADAGNDRLVLRNECGQSAPSRPRFHAYYSTSTCTMLVPTERRFTPLIHSKVTTRRTCRVTLAKECFRCFYN